MCRSQYHALRQAEGQEGESLTERTWTVISAVLVVVLVALLVYYGLSLVWTPAPLLTRRGATVADVRAALLETNIVPLLLARTIQGTVELPIVCVRARDFNATWDEYTKALGGVRTQSYGRNQVSTTSKITSGDGGELCIYTALSHT